MRRVLITSALAAAVIGAASGCMPVPPGPGSTATATATSTPPAMPTGMPTGATGPTTTPSGGMSSSPGPGSPTQSGGYTVQTSATCKRPRRCAGWRICLFLILWEWFYGFRRCCEWVRKGRTRR